MTSYLSFIERYASSGVRMVVLQIKEAHSVERDETGKIVDGWPIGSEVEYPAHQSIADRQRMALLVRETYAFPDFVPSYLDTFPENAFDAMYGVWPDQVLLFDESRRLVFRGGLEPGGVRRQSFTDQLEASGLLST